MVTQIVVHDRGKQLAAIRSEQPRSGAGTEARSVRSTHGSGAQPGTVTTVSPWTYTKWSVS